MRAEVRCLERPPVEAGAHVLSMALLDDVTGVCKRLGNVECVVITGMLTQNESLK